MARLLATTERITRRRRWIICLCAGALPCALGCSRGAGRQPVHGSVTLDGQPLDDAVIVFIPDDPSSGRQTGAEIRGGHYAISAEDGVAVGRNRVEITTYVGPRFEPVADGSHVAKGASARKAPRQVPDNYNVRSILSVQVLVDDNQAFDFELHTHRSLPAGRSHER